MNMGKTVQGSQVGQVQLVFCKQHTVIHIYTGEYPFTHPPSPVLSSSIRPP